MDQKAATSIVQCGREINLEELEQIQETVELFSKRLTRRELAETICEHLEWYTATGSRKVDACMKLLGKLEARGVLELPSKRGQPKGRPAVISFTGRTEPHGAIVGRLRDVEPVGLQIVGDKEATGLWNEYVFRYHSLGYKKPFGCCLRYFIQSSQGVLGCALFSGAAKALRARDRWIGWTEQQRLRNLAWVINNSRFLIFSWVRIKNLASHVLGQIERQIGQDWERHWGYRPVLMETFVDPRHYEGSSYKGANWVLLGETTGEGLVRQGKIYTTSPKKLFVKPLVKEFRTLLCSESLRGRVEP
jgi:hypothetical protein